MRSQVEGSTDGFRPGEAEGSARTSHSTWTEVLLGLESWLRSPAFLVDLLAVAAAGGGTAASRWYYGSMAITYSKLTAQGETSVPDEVRRKLGVGPDSVLEWEEEGERIIVRRAARYTSEDLHRALFEEPPEPRTLEELEAGVEQAIKDRHARR